MYTNRYYRTWVSGSDLTSFRLLQHESDIEIRASGDLTYSASRILLECRGSLNQYMKSHPEFIHAMHPLAFDTSAPEVVKWMLSASSAWNVGPMAAVAGAVARKLGESLRSQSSTVIVENGGDIYVIGPGTVDCALFAGEESPFSGKLGFTVDASSGVGICTSSGTVGHSFSMGRADAVTVIARDAAVADAAATALANGINSPEDVRKQLKNINEGHGIIGAIACCGHNLATWNVKLHWNRIRREA